MLTHTLLSMATSVTFVVTYLLVIVVRVEPWWSAQVGPGAMLTYLFSLCVGDLAAVAADVFSCLLSYANCCYTPQYFIPITGMLLGNATSGVSLGLTNIIEALTTQRAQVETMLALGATRWEATKTHVHRAIITAMTPVLNQMSVVGVVSIPGMMTGQILGGQAPLQAARYQVRSVWVSYPDPLLIPDQQVTHTSGGSR